jgi:hypothetical protein
MNLEDMSKLSQEITYTPPQLAKMLKKTPQAITSAIRERRIVAHKILGRYVITESEVKRILKENDN